MSDDRLLLPALQKCTSGKEQQDIHCAVAMATLLATISFCQKPNIPFATLCEFMTFLFPFYHFLYLRNKKP